MVLYELQRDKIFCSFANILATKSKEFCKIKSFFQFAPTKIELTYCNSMAYSIFSTYFAPTFPLLSPYFATILLQLSSSDTLGLQVFIYAFFLQFSREFKRFLTT